MYSHHCQALVSEVEMRPVIQVMICDDSSVMRRLISAALNNEPDINVVCEATNGREACEKVADAKPHAVIMDIEMPEMDGVDAVKSIRRTHPRLPIIMFSSLTSRGAEATLDSIAAGATDFVTKPASVGHVSAGLKQLRLELIPKIRHCVAGAARKMIKPVENTSQDCKSDLPATKKTSPTNQEKSSKSVDTSIRDITSTSRGPVDAIAIGVSTGGPQALQKLLLSITKKPTLPILIVQHMPPMFTGLLAERLGKESGFHVREACDGDQVVPGEILIAPGDYHMRVSKSGSSKIIKLGQDPPLNSCRPAVDPLFESMADCYGGKALGIVMTGMGKDGESGARAMKKKGARIIAQDQHSSVVWGMPRIVVENGLADDVMNVEQIACAITKNCSTQKAVVPAIAR